MYLLPNKPPDPNEPRDCAHDTTSRDYQSFNELDGTLSIHTVCDACCETLEVKGWEGREYMTTRDAAVYRFVAPERRA